MKTIALPSYLLTVAAMSTPSVAAEFPRAVTAPFVEAYFQYEETGNWQSLNDLGLTYPQGASYHQMMEPYREAAVLFSKLYSQSIGALPNTGIPILDDPTIFDLMRQDNAVYEQFKQYAIHGKLTTPIDPNDPVFVQHLNAILDAAQGGLSSVVSFQITEEGLESYLLVDQTAPGTSTPPSTTAPTEPEPPTLPNPETITPLLPDLICRSNIPFRDAQPPVSPTGPQRAPCPADGIPGRYVPTDPKDSDADWDCDDEADALGAWIINHLRDQFPGITFRKMYICPEPMPSPCNGCCHTILVIVYIKDGIAYTWFIDPSTGIWTGLESTSSCQQEVPAEKAACIRQLWLERARSLFCNLDPNPYTVDFCTAEYYEPERFGHPGKPPSGERPLWYTDPKVRKWLCEQLGVTEENCENVLCWYQPTCQSPQLPDAP